MYRHTRSTVAAWTIPFLLLVFAAGPIDELRAQQAPRLEVLVPEADTSTFAGARHRIAGNTDPSSRVFINGEEVEVYGNGAFVDLVTLTSGENRITFRAEAPDGRSSERVFVVHRPEPQQPLPGDELEIDIASITPNDSLWLKAGDVLEVRFRGSPGRRATFEVRGMTPRVPMRELAPEEAGGVIGIYSGRYVIQPRDEVLNAPLIIRMRGRGFASNSVRSDARVTVAPYDVPRVVEVVGRRPYLNAGLGTDRLGGAQLGRIDPGVRLRVDGRMHDQYRVRLGSDMQAWLPRRFARLLPSDTPLPRAVTGSISVRGDERADQVDIALPVRLPYVASHHSDPARIVVDLYGAESNTNWITHLTSADGIQRVRWEQPGHEHYRMIIELEHPGEWGYEVGYADRSTLRVRVKRPPVIASDERPLEGMVLVVDAGHGGRAAGALGAAGTLEKDVTLPIAQRLEELLVQRGARVVMTRDRDEDVAMSDRIDTTLEAQPDLLVSIHANSTGLSSDPEGVRGTSMYYRHPVYRPLADAVYAEVLDLGLPEFGVVGSFNFSLNQFTEFPNVLVETAFISHPEEEILLTDPQFQQQMAEAVVRGLERFAREHGSRILVEAEDSTAEDPDARMDDGR